jgi:hypothetical protein
MANSIDLGFMDTRSPISQLGNSSAQAWRAVFTARATDLSQCRAAALRLSAVFNGQPILSVGVNPFHGW